jgi:hypothetical protein
MVAVALSDPNPTFKIMDQSATATMLEMASKFPNKFEAPIRHQIVGAQTVVSNSVLYFICQSCWTLEIMQNLATKN